MEDFTTQDLIEELQQYHQVIPDRRDGGVTRREWAAANNCSEKTAKKTLEGLVSEGILSREINRLGPRSQGFVYYKKPQP